MSGLTPLLGTANPFATLEIIRDVCDFPSPIIAPDGNLRIPLEINTAYYIDTPVLILPIPFFLPTNTSTGVESIGILSDTSAQIIYVGGPPLFFGDSMNTLDMEKIIFIGALGFQQCFDLTGNPAQSIFNVFTCAFIGWNDLGIFNGVNLVTWENFNYIDVNLPLKIHNMQAFNLLRGISLKVTRPSSNNPIFIITGIVGNGIMDAIAGQLLSSGESLIAIDSNVIILSSIDITSCVFPGIPGIPFFQSDLTGSITAFADSVADPGVDTTVTTSGPHNLSQFRTTAISGTTNYNGTFTITRILGPTSFDINTAFVADDATGTFLTQSLDQTDIRVFAENNGALANSTTIADTSLTTSEIVTINVVGQFEPINGINWTSDIAENFTTDNAGNITYIGIRPVRVLSIGTASVSKVGGGTDQIEMQICFNGGTLPKTASLTENKTPTTLTCVGSIDLFTGDVINLQVRNNSTTANIIVDVGALDVITPN